MTFGILFICGPSNINITIFKHNLLFYQTAVKKQTFNLQQAKALSLLANAHTFSRGQFIHFSLYNSDNNVN